MSLAEPPTGRSIPYFAPTIGEEEIESVVETLRSGWLTTGPKTKKFEQEFADAVQAQHAMAVSSCTAALHLALEAIGVGPGDEVVVPTMTFASTGEVVVHLGGKPVLVDIQPDTFNMDPAKLEECISDKTKAIIPVHYGGQPCPLDEIHAIAQRHGLRVIEDAAHAIPARYKGKSIGAISDITCFSFYANKTITTGEGGMITTNDEKLAERMRIMSLHGISKDAWKRFAPDGKWQYEILAPGYKYNMTDIAAAIGIHQLARRDEFLAARRHCANRYDEAFAGMAEIDAPVVRDDVETAWHIYAIRLVLDKLTIDRNEFIKRLNASGVGTSVHYAPLHMHPYYREVHGYDDASLPVATETYHRIISLPIYPRMTDQDIDYVIQTVKRIVDGNRS